MAQGIAVFGLNGGGKSTLAHAFAKRTGYFEMDAEDYYFPEQRASRKWALEHAGAIPTEHLGELPFSEPRAKCQVQKAMLEDIKAHPQFILSGVTVNWSDEILSYLKAAFWIQTPLEERLKRIQAREEKRFGARVLAGGDMFAQQMEFRKTVENRDAKAVEESAGRLTCAVVVLDGTLPVEENVEKMIDRLPDRPTD